MLQPNSDLSTAGSAYSHIGKPNMVGEYIQTVTGTDGEADAYVQQAWHCLLWKRRV